ncbi:APC family permease [Bacillus salipaludis]|uniref:APC family permease n=1 Tax=Bacillus salipaludis TaxID=2547811 RepID=A0A4R5VWB2_9BACI|nr:APC family permease [Bacillus salipaludis]MDQ6597432.1 APC family permease [Bacillus salipaludis]TDK63140.1 APC family permease [Bacillus salipaludis]
MENVTLKRSLGLWAIVGLGLGYMTPTIAFDTFGIVSKGTNGVVPLAYLTALLVMLFTAISYGKMVQVFPSAGSAYTYTKETMNPYLGFLVGWAALLDYILLPMVNALIIRIYMVSIFPSVPAWVWVLIWVAICTGLNVWSMGKTSNLNSILVAFSLILIVVFIILAFVKFSQGMGQGTILTTEPLFHANIHFGAVLTGATVVCFSFIGFDAVTMYAEEAVDKKIMPKAIMLTVFIGGAIFFVTGYFAQALFPNVSNFKNTDDTLPEIALYVGGTLFKLFLLAGAFAATAASGLASHASVSRLLYVMGRNGALPRKLFGYVHPKFRTPAFNVVFVGAVSMLAISPSLELVSSVINFGALIAFTFVNLSVIAHFVFKEKRYKTAKDLFTYLIMPLIGAGLTGILWSNLHADALIGGIGWTLIGVLYLLYQTKIRKNDIAVLDFEEAG